MALFIKNVAAPYLLKEMESRLVIGKLATNISKDIDDLAWNGNQITFPTYSRVAEANVIETKGSVTPVEIDGDSSVAPIKHVGAGVKYHADTLRTSGGKILANMALRDLADAMALKLDADIMSEAITGSTLRYAAAAADALTADELEGGLSLFGDRQNVNEFSGILIHSKLFPSVLAMPGFSSTSLTYTTQNNGIVKGQQVGFDRGIPLFLTNNANYISEAGSYECKTVILKKGALGYALKKSVEFNENYNNETFYTSIVADTYSACKLLDTDKAVLICKTISD